MQCSEFIQCTAHIKLQSNNCTFGNFYNCYFFHLPHSTNWGPLTNRINHSRRCYPHHPRKGNMELQRTIDWAWISLYSSLDNKETSLSRVLNSNYLPCQIIRLSIKKQKLTSTINPDQIRFAILWEKYTCTDLILEEFLALTILELWTSQIFNLQSSIACNQVQIMLEFQIFNSIFRLKKHIMWKKSLSDEVKLNSALSFYSIAKKSTRTIHYLGDTKENG